MPRLPVILLVAATAYLTATAADWPQFRGPNAFGVSDTTGLPTEFGPDKNVIWRTALPPGHSSPVLSADRIFLTAFSEDQLYVITLERSTGKILWRRELPRMRKQKLHNSNSPASPSVATDGRNGSRGSDAPARPRHIRSHARRWGPPPLARPATDPALVTVPIA